MWIYRVESKSLLADILFAGLEFRTVRILIIESLMI